MRGGAGPSPPSTAARGLAGSAGRRPPPPPPLPRAPLAPRHTRLPLITVTLSRELPDAVDELLQGRRHLGGWRRGRERRGKAGREPPLRAAAAASQSAARKGRGVPRDARRPCVTSATPASSRESCRRYGNRRHPSARPPGRARPVSSTREALWAREAVTQQGWVSVCVFGDVMMPSHTPHTHIHTASCRGMRGPQRVDPLRNLILY